MVDEWEISEEEQRTSMEQTDSFTVRYVKTKHGKWLRQDNDIFNPEDVEKVSDLEAYAFDVAPWIGELDYIDLHFKKRKED